MRTFLLAILAILGVVRCGIGSPAPPDGVVLGEVVSFDHVNWEGPDFRVYRVLVYADSTYNGMPAVARGEYLDLATPGGPHSTGRHHFEGGTIRSTSIVVGEKFVAFYRVIAEHRLIMDKWTVWPRGGRRASATKEDRNALLQEEARLEEMLNASSRSSLGESLELYHTQFDLNSFVEPSPARGVTWVNYGLFGGEPVGSLREVEALFLQRYASR